VINPIQVFQTTGQHPTISAKRVTHGISLPKIRTFYSVYNNFNNNKNRGITRSNIKKKTKKKNIIDLLDILRQTMPFSGVHGIVEMMVMALGETC
jgi:hypothetical protein